MCLPIIGALILITHPGSLSAASLAVVIFGLSLGAELDIPLGHKVALKGPVTTPVGKGFRSVNVELRQKLHLYANYRPARSMPGAGSTCRRGSSEA